MPIEQTRVLALIRAGTDAVNGLDLMYETLQRELKLVREHVITPEQALTNLEVMLIPNALLNEPIETRLTLQREALRNSPKAIAENKRRKIKLRLKRKGLLSEGEGEERDFDPFAEL